LNLQRSEVTIIAPTGPDVVDNIGLLLGIRHGPDAAGLVARQ